jgi:hypothetical protein
MSPWNIGEFCLIITLIPELPVLTWVGLLLRKAIRLPDLQTAELYGVNI